MHLQNAVRQLYHLNKVCLPALRNGFKNKKKNTWRTQGKSMLVNARRREIYAES